jgi:hypothetical protein
VLVNLPVYGSLEQPIHTRRARLQHRPQLVPVDQFGNGVNSRRAAVRRAKELGLLSRTARD